LDRLLRRHLAQMEAQREHDARAPVHAPEERTDAILGRHLKIVVPKEHLPVERSTFGPERRRKNSALRVVARGHEALQMVPGIQLVKNGCTREMWIVAAQ